MKYKSTTRHPLIATHRPFAFRPVPFASCLWLLLPIASVRAEIQFTQPIANAGEVRTGARLLHRFAFINAGTKTLEIIEVRVSCGCLAPTLARRTFQPGEKGELVLEVNTLSQSAGPHAWPVHIGYRSGMTVHETTVQLTGHVVPEIMVQPPSLTIFAGGSVGHDIQVTDVRPHPLTIKEVRTSSPRLHAGRALPGNTAKAHLVGQIRIDVAADCPPGRHEDAVTIFTDDPGYPEIKVPVTIVKQARNRLSVMPNQVTLLAAAGQSVPSRILLVRGPDNRSVVIDHVTADHPALSYHWAQGPDNLATVKLIVNRKEIPAETLHSALHIHVSAPVAETLTIPVTCILK
jgi:hypothetical protein